MSIIAKPYTFTALTLAQSAQVNADFDTLYSWANGNVDNANIGTAGIYASQIKGTTTATTTFTSSVGWTMTTFNTNQVPLTVSLVSGAGADAFDVKNSVNTKLFWVDNGGDVNSVGYFNAGTGIAAGFQINNQSVLYNASNTDAAIRPYASGGNVLIQNDAGTTTNATFPSAGGMTLSRGGIAVTNGSTTATGFLTGSQSLPPSGQVSYSSSGTGATIQGQIFVNGTGGFKIADGTNTNNWMVVDTGGGIRTTPYGAGGALGYVPPVFNSSGTALGSASRIYFFTGIVLTWTASQNSAGYTLNFPTAFTSTSTYGLWCTVTTGTIANGPSTVVANKSAGSAVLTGIASSSTSGTLTVDILVIGA